MEALTLQLGWDANTVFEGLLHGSPETVVSGIATCAMPTVEAIRKAIAVGCNVLLCDGHPSYFYDSMWSAAPSIAATIDAMPEVVAKGRMIDQGGLAIIRIHTAWQAAQPASAARSFTAELGLGTQVANIAVDHVICDVEPLTVAQFAKRIGTSGGRLIGDREWPVSRVAVMSGIASPAQLGGILRDPRIDAVVAGEVIEWEGGPYMLDVQETGRRCSLILAGFANSLEPDAAAMAQWAAKIFAPMPVKPLRSDGDFIWSVGMDLS